MPGFGNSFKSAREAKDLTLAKIAQETRISTRFLRAIEDEAFHILPGGVFDRGFIRTFAERVGLDPEKAVAEYTALTAEVATLELELVESSSKLNSERHIVPIAIGGLVVLIVLFYVLIQDAATSMTPTSSIENSEEPNTSESVATLARANTPSTTVTPTPGTESVLKTETPRPTSETNGTGNTVDSATTTTDSEIVAEAPDIGVRIQLQVHDTTWISVQSDDEELVEVELGPGTNRSFAAEEEMDLTIGNAAGLTLYINGEQALDLGGQGRVRVLNITPSNFRRYTGS